MLDAWSPRLLSVLRIVAAFVYVQHGGQKLFAFPVAMSSSGATVSPFSLLGAAAIIEIVGGLLILVGLFTRVAAFICSGEMAAAYFLAHLPHAVLPIVNRGELPVLFCFIFLYFAAAGPGPWSLDALRGRAAS
jgi:putative oxidoreductase